MRQNLRLGLSLAHPSSLLYPINSRRNRTLPPLHILLLLNPVHALLNIDLKVLHVHRRHEQRRVREQVIHLLKRTFLRLGLESPEVQRVGEIADDEEEVEAPADALHGDGRHLANHSVEGEGDHDADGNALGAGAGVEDFGGDDPWVRIR